MNVGIDISKDDFRACFCVLTLGGKRSIKSSRKFKNTLEGFPEFLQWIEKNRLKSVKKSESDLPLHLTMEATGVYHEQLAHFLNQKTQEKNYRISVILPNKFKAYLKSLNIVTKTDKSDAQYLGYMGLERVLEVWQPLTPNILTLKQLCRDRVSISEELTAVKNKIHALEHSFQPNRDAMRRLRSRERLLKKQIAETEVQVKDLIDADEYLKERVDKILKVKGIGLITVATVIAETNGFKLFTSRGQLVSYAGYDVVEKQSGTSVKGIPRMSKRGNRFIRRALYFPAITTVKYEPQFQQLYDRIVDKNGIKKKALVAVQRKLLLLIYALFKKNEAYNANYPNTENSNEEEKNCRQDTYPAYSG